MTAKSVCFLLLSLSCCFLFAEEAAKGEYDEIAKKVEQKILDEDKVKIENLKVLHHDGVIYLEGVADVYGSRYVAGEVAAKVEGVKSVENHIAVRSSEVSDIEIESTLISKIQRLLRPEPFDLISVKVNRGAVLLSGMVRDATLIDKAFREAIWTPGVRSIDNQIKRASIATGDERLRRAIYQRLAREYPQYFVGPHPSIIILVDSARVTLAGYVNSEVEKQKIGSTIRSIIGVLSVENLLQTK